MVNSNLLTYISVSYRDHFLNDNYYWCCLLLLLLLFIGVTVLLRCDLNEKFTLSFHFHRPFSLSHLNLFMHETLNLRCSRFRIWVSVLWDAQQFLAHNFHKWNTEKCRQRYNNPETLEKFLWKNHLFLKFFFFSSINNEHIKTNQKISHTFS